MNDRSRPAGFYHPLTVEIMLSNSPPKPLSHLFTIHHIYIIFASPFLQPLPPLVLVRCPKYCHHRRYYHSAILTIHSLHHFPAPIISFFPSLTYFLRRPAKKTARIYFISDLLQLCTALLCLMRLLLRTLCKNMRSCVFLPFHQTQCTLTTPFVQLFYQPPFYPLNLALLLNPYISYPLTPLNFLDKFLDFFVFFIFFVFLSHAFIFPTNITFDLSLFTFYSILSPIHCQI